MTSKNPTHPATLELVDHYADTVLEWLATVVRHEQDGADGLDLASADYRALIAHCKALGVVERQTLSKMTMLKMRMAASLMEGAAKVLKGVQRNIASALELAADSDRGKRGMEVRR